MIIKIQGKFLKASHIESCSIVSISKRVGYKDLYSFDVQMLSGSTHVFEYISKATAQNGLNDLLTQWKSSISEIKCLN